jgi:hypothetical protein
MIKPEELRIGNLFYPINRDQEIHIPASVPFKIMTVEPFKVKAIMAEKHPALNEWVEFDIREVSPISLTSEWLERFGFEIMDAEVDFMEYEIEGTDISICNDGGLDFESENPYYFLWDGNYQHKTVVKYVHQLQNLYFTLTGEELTLK